MRQIAILFFCLALTSCSKVETASNDNTLTNLNRNTSVLPTVQENTSLKPVTPDIKLTSRQKKHLNESLPPQVREVLEKAEKFEILAEIRGQNEFDGEGTTFEPNRVAKIANETNKKEILKAFYSDAATDEPPANCYTPRHKIRAVYQDKTVEIEICFACAKFYVESSSGKFNGTIVREGRKSEDLFIRLIETKSIEIK